MRGRWALVVVLLTALTGCVSVPTVGPLERAGQASGSSSARVEIEPAPPGAGAGPGLIVEGFLHAMSAGSGNYDVARLYLSDGARARWQPGARIRVYNDSYPTMTVTDKGVVLDAPLVGEVGADGSFTHLDTRLRTDFGLVKDAQGQWRIDSPPDGLLVSEYLFDKFYRSYNLYFFDPGYQTLVPDPIYVLRNDQAATSLMQALLRGPTRWLAPAVVTAFPAQTEMSLSAPVGNGIVDVALGDSIANLNEAQRSRLAAQIAWTLRQIEGTTGFRLSMNGQAWSVREQGTDGVISVNAFGSVDPIPSGRADTLYVTTRKGLFQVNSAGSQPQLAPVPGNCQKAAAGADQLAVAANPVGDGQAAFVTDNRLSSCVLPGESEISEAQGLAGTLGRPEFSRFGELWIPATEDDHSRIYRAGDAPAVSVGDEQLDSSPIRAMAISPDGMRAAIIRDVGGDWRLGLARINRDGQVRVESWRQIGLTRNDGQGPGQPFDVGWATDTTLLVLAAENNRTQPKPYIVQQDGTDLRQLGPGDWTPMRLSTDARHAGFQAVVLGSRGTVWSYQDDYRWPVLVNDVTAVAWAR